MAGRPPGGGSFTVGGSSIPGSTLSSDPDGNIPDTGNSGKGNNTKGGAVACFLADAPVLTPDGYRRIDSLKVGDLVLTAKGVPSAIQRIKVQRVTANPSVNPYVIPKGTFGAMRRLLISPNHKVLVEGRGLTEAFRLGLEQTTMTDSFDYYNLELESWTNMIIAGVTVESLAPNRRITVTIAEFKEMVSKAYGVVTPAVLAGLQRTCRFLEGGRVEIPVLRVPRG